jgi:hypothetical protein
MHWILTYGTGVYYRSKISSEVQVLTFRYLSSGDSVFTWARMWGSVAGCVSHKGSANKNVWETLPSAIPEALCSKELRGTIWANYDDYEIVKSDHSRSTNFATFISSRWETSAQIIENIFFLNCDVESPVPGDRSKHHTCQQGNLDSPKVKL